MGSQGGVSKLISLLSHSTVVLGESMAFLARFGSKCSGGILTCTWLIPRQTCRTGGREPLRCRNPAREEREGIQRHTALGSPGRETYLSL